MSYKVFEVDSETIFTQLELVIWHAHHQPYQPHFSAYHPVFGPTAADRDVAIKQSIDRKWAAHSSDPNSHWLCVIEESNGKVVGGCQWKFYLSDPYIKSGPSPAYDPRMWPDDTVGRSFVEMMMHQQYAHRKRWLRRAHAVCQQMAIHPKHRGRGLGSQLMEWGLEIAQKHELEVFLHSTEMARRLYEKHGLRVLQKIEIDMEVPDPSDEWERLRHELGPLRFFIMWKPKNGIFEEGHTILPWEIEQ